MNHVFVLIANPAHPVLDAAAVQRASDQLQAAGAAVGPVDWLAPGVACDLPFEGPAEGPPATVSLPGIDAVALSPEGRRKRLLVRADRDVDIQGFLRAWLKRVKAPGSVRLTVDVDPYSFL